MAWAEDDMAIVAEWPLRAALRCHKPM